MPRLLHVIQGADMRCRHRGFTKFLQTNKIKLKDLNPGDIIALLNNQKNYLVLFTALKEKDSHGFLGYYKSPHGRVPPEAFKYIADSMGSNGFNMNQAIKSGLEEILKKRRRRKNEGAV